MEDSCDITKIEEICDVLMKSVTDMNSYRKSVTTDKPDVLDKQEGQKVNKQDIENLMHFTQIWTDVVENEAITSEIRENIGDLLYDVGFFHVKVNPNVSLLEFFGLLSKIPWESLKLDGMDTVSYITIAQLFGEQKETIAIQLMVLGYHFKFWDLINPTSCMNKTNKLTGLLLSAMGNLVVYISPNFIKNCQELIESVDLS